MIGSNTAGSAKYGASARIDDRVDHLLPLVGHLDEPGVRAEHAFGMLEVSLDHVDPLGRLARDLQRAHRHLQAATMIAILCDEHACELDERRAVIRELV